MPERDVDTIFSNGESTSSRRVEGKGVWRQWTGSHVTMTVGIGHRYLCGSPEEDTELNEAYEDRRMIIKFIYCDKQGLLTQFF